MLAADERKPARQVPGRFPVMVSVVSRGVDISNQEAIM